MLESDFYILIASDTDFQIENYDLDGQGLTLNWPLVESFLELI